MHWTTLAAQGVGCFVLAAGAAGVVARPAGRLGSAMSVRWPSSLAFARAAVGVLLLLEVAYLGTHVALTDRSALEAWGFGNALVLTGAVAGVRSVRKRAGREASRGRWGAPAAASWLGLGLGAVAVAVVTTGLRGLLGPLGIDRSWGGVALSSVMFVSRLGASASLFMSAFAIALVLVGEAWCSRPQQVVRQEPVQ